MRGVNKSNRVFSMILVLVFAITGLFTSGTAFGYGSNYTVVEGDCFWTIAQKLGIDVDALQSANSGIDFEALQIGQQIIIPGGGTQDTNYSNASGGTSSYTVVSGDSLWLIADKFGVSVDAIKSASGLTSDFLQIGQVLTIPGSGQSYSAGPSAPTQPAGETSSYTVASGDNLWLIASNFGVSIDSIKSASGLTSDFLQVGQALTIPGGGQPYQEVNRGSVSRDYGSSDVTYGELIDWKSINDIFPIGSSATLQDFETGRTFQVHHLFGTNHADCEPLTADDAYIMKQIFGGEWSWERRAAIIWLDGRPVACSMAGMPHGTSQDINGNDFDGHFDLHFLNSRTHGTDRVDEDHQAMVRRAAGQ